jgi:hypothetical protein
MQTWVASTGFFVFAGTRSRLEARVGESGKAPSFQGEIYKSLEADEAFQIPKEFFKNM